MNNAPSKMENPYLVVEPLGSARSRAYEYSRYAERLGSTFVAAVCQHARDSYDKQFLIKGSRAVGLILAVAHLDSFFCILKNTLDKYHLVSTSAMESSHLHEFANDFLASRSITNCNLSTSDTHHYEKNLAILKRYADAGILCVDLQHFASVKQSPYYVLHTEPTNGTSITYEYSRIADRVGAMFVASACALIRELRKTANVTERTWQDNYAERFDHFLGQLHPFLESMHYRSTEALSEDGWQQFVDYLARSILEDRVSGKTGNMISAKTKDKQRLTTNKLLANLALRGLLPKRFEIPPPGGRMRAVDGESKFTQRGFYVKEKKEVAYSPFILMIQQGDKTNLYSYEAFQPLARFFLLEALPALDRYYNIRTNQQRKVCHQVVTSLLSFLMRQKGIGSMPDFFRNLGSAAFRRIEAMTWEKALYEWRADLICDTATPESSRSILRKHKLIGTLNQVWAVLASSNVVPEVKLKGIKNAKARQTSKSRPCLAQLSPRENGTEHGKDTERNALISKLTRPFDEFEKSEAIEFITALYAHLPSQNVKLLDLDSLVSEIRKLNTFRLESLRRCAELDFLQWYEHWLFGQRALIEATHSSQELIALLDYTERSVSDRRRNATKLITGTTLPNLGNALSLMLEALDGNSSGISGRYHHLKRRWGGHEQLQAYLHPHKRATVALWILLLVDTGANCEVVREMPTNCLTKTEDSTHMTVSFGQKARAHYVRINDSLPVAPQPGQKLSAVQAIRYYLSMSVRYREEADVSVANTLFLDTQQGHIVTITESRAREDFKAFLRDHPELHNLDIRPSSIRPSCLLELQHRDPLIRIETAQAQADHASATTTGIYTQRTHTKLVQIEKIRAFTIAFQAVIIESIDGAAEKLGMSHEAAVKLFSNAARSGLGVACLNSKAGIQPGTQQGESCTRLDACPGCEMRYIVGTADNIADLILFNEYLESREENEIMSNAIAWENRWLPWRTLAEVALAKFSQGETASSYIQAKSIADARRPNYKPFPLF
ncbi:hypothetical protein [Massilia yuzhufengensis]|nr:hypothetical protein [Massilia yuzhufengensis]